MTTSRGTEQMLWTSSEQVASVLQAMAEAKHAEAIRIGRLVASLRDRKGWSQEDLAREIDVSTSTVSRWERGLHKGYGPNVRKLAGALDVEPAILTPADDLLLGSQLDRIEQKLDEVLVVLTQPSSAAAAAIVADVVARLEEAAASRRSQADGQRGRSGEGRRRKSA